MNGNQACKNLSTVPINSITNNIRLSAVTSYFYQQVQHMTCIRDLNHLEKYCAIKTLFPGNLSAKSVCGKRYNLFLKAVGVRDNW